MREPNPSCIWCKGRGKILENNGKIPVLSTIDKNTGLPIPYYGHLKESETLIDCSCVKH